MRLVPLLAITLVGCGRVGFDEVADVSGDALPIGHDEDGDDVSDAIDRCPHIADDQRDTDQDGVGDACDREPMQPRQRLAYFNAMRAEDEALAISGRGRWTQLADAREFDSIDDGNGQLIKNLVIEDGDIWIGSSITSKLTTSDAWQIAIAVVQVTDDDPYYYVQLYEDSDSGYISLSHWDGAQYRQRGTMGIDNGLHTGELELAMFVGRTPGEIAVTGGWGAESYAAVGTAPAYVGGDKVAVVYEGLIVELRYIAIVTTQ